MEGLIGMARRIRNSEIAIFCAFVLFGVAWLPLQQIRDPLPVWRDAVRPHPEIRTTFMLVQAAGGVAFLAILIGGLPIIGTLVVRAVRARRRDVLLPLLTPFLAVALLAGYALLASGTWTARQTSAPDAPLTPLAVALQIGLVALVALAVAGSTAGVAIAVARGEPEARVVRFALAPAVVATLAMGAGMLATLALGALTAAEAPQLRSVGFVPVILLMCGATVLAGLSLSRGMRGRNRA